MTSSTDPAASGADTNAEEQPLRRGFFYKLGTIFVGSVLLVVPLVSGLAVLFDPLRRRVREVDGKPVPADDEFVRVTTLDLLPADGVPRPFTVKKDIWDAWNFYPDQRVGTVFLRRMPDSDEVVALNATCPHLGCPVGFRVGQNRFHCPCHNSGFEVDGQRIDPMPGGKTNPAPRALDGLEVEVTEQGDVLVEFIEYLTGRHEAVKKA